MNEYFLEDTYFITNIIMATIVERLAILETKITNLQKTCYVLVAAIVGQFGVNFIPYAFAVLT